jgi:hypothetical protein
MTLSHGYHKSASIADLVLWMRMSKQKKKSNRWEKKNGRKKV